MKQTKLDLNPEELDLFQKLKKPIEIQAFLDELSYNPQETNLSPKLVLRERKANCLEGAVFAAACLYLHGRPPLIVDLLAANDDDHLLAVYAENSRWGAISKSNFTTLRFREPVYQDIRELVMSYFDFYFNVLGEKTLREYSDPVDLQIFDPEKWIVSDEIGDIDKHLITIPHQAILTPAMAKSLHKVDSRLLEAGLLGVNLQGLYQPGRGS